MQCHRGMKLPKAIVNNPMAIAPKGAAASAPDISALVSARALAEHQARHDEEVAASNRKVEAAANIAKRDNRVSMVRDDEGLIVSVAPKFLSDMLKEQFGWGFCFAFVNPGVFIMMALAGILYALGISSAGLLMSLTIVLWMLLLTASNVVFALVTRRRLTLALTKNGYYSLYERNPKRPIMFGPMSELKVDVDKSNPAALGRVRFEDKHARVEADKLSPQDLQVLRQTFPQ